MKRAPKQQSNGKCAITNCEKALPQLALITGDPFCSSWCCRLFYGVVFSSDEGSRKWATANPGGGKRKPPSAAAKAGNTHAVRRSTAKRRAAEVVA